MVRPWKFLQFSLICLLLGFVSWLLRHSLSISPIWIHLCCGGFDFFLVDCDCFLGCSDWLENIFHVEVSLNSSDETFVVFGVIFRHLMQSVMIFAPKFLYTLSLLSSALDFLAREMVSISCYRLGQQLEETSLLRPLLFLKALVNALGSDN